MMNRLKVTIAIALLMTGGAGINGVAQESSDESGFSQLYASGQAAMAAGKYDEARSAFERLEKMNPGVAEVHGILGVLYYKLADFNRAIEEIRTARKLKPGLPGLDALLSLSLAESGKPREALPGLEKAFRTSTEPDVKRQAGLEIAHAYSELSMDRRAVEVALELRDRYHGDPEVLYSVGKILGNSAYLTMQDLFRGSGDSVWAHLAEGEAQESQGQFENAITSYRRVLEIDPRQLNVHYRIGRTYLTRWKSSHAHEDVIAAEEELTKEIEIDPENANAAYELAGLRSKDGDAAAAQRLYESAIHYYPDFEEAEVGLGRVLLDEEKASLAARHLERATVLRPDDEVAWYRLAQAERQLGDAQAQKNALTTFQKLHATSTTQRYNMPSLQLQDSVTPQTLGNEIGPQ